MAKFQKLSKFTSANEIKKSMKLAFSSTKELAVKGFGAQNPDDNYNTKEGFPNLLYNYNWMATRDYNMVLLFLAICNYAATLSAVAKTALVTAANATDSTNVFRKLIKSDIKKKGEEITGVKYKVDVNGIDTVLKADGKLLDVCLKEIYKDFKYNQKTKKEDLDPGNRDNNVTAIRDTIARRMTKVTNWVINGPDVARAYAFVCDKWGVNLDDDIKALFETAAANDGNIDPDNGAGGGGTNEAGGGNPPPPPTGGSNPPPPPPPPTGGPTGGLLEGIKKGVKLRKVDSKKGETPETTTSTAAPGGETLMGQLSGVLKKRGQASAHEPKTDSPQAGQVVTTGKKAFEVLEDIFGKLSPNKKQPLEKAINGKLQELGIENPDVKTNPKIRTEVFGVFNSGNNSTKYIEVKNFMGKELSGSKIWDRIVTLCSMTPKDKEKLTDYGKFKGCLASLKTNKDKNVRILASLMEFALEYKPS